MIESFLDIIVDEDSHIYFSYETTPLYFYYIIDMFCLKSFYTILFTKNDYHDVKVYYK